MALLAAVATSAARELYELARRWAKEEPDPAGQAAAIAAAHTRYLIDHRVGMDVFFAATFESPSFSELHRERRNLVNVLLAPCEMLCREHEEAVELVGQLHAQSHGFGALFLSGCYGHRRDVVVAKAKSAAQTMVAAHSRTAPDRFPLANG
ncbi:hypothetical protein BJY18_007106 [Amycolatopsis jiangsuensis]|uniref:Uncharacterized protein n=1 Tax=Amycolatopsis jiangsuensis TaxID=1181879 RepID=A0A840J3H9_9PSEU|nr:hypothetical protein [Amycolatopsis jiangsuensis]